MHLHFSLTKAVDSNINSNTNPNNISITGTASLGNVTIQKHNKDSLTGIIGDYTTITYSDGSVISLTQADLNTNKVFNNDTVTYNVTYNITTPGTIKLTFTMPANNTIDPASVATAAGCLDGSTVTSTKTNNTTSYTNNQATCYIDSDDLGTGTWTIKTNPWGGNNEQITPSITINDQPANTQIPGITIVGKGDYGVKIRKRAAQGIVSGLNKDIYPTLGIIAYKNSSGGVIGVEPLASDGSLSLKISNNFPKDWEIIWALSLFFNIATSGGTLDSPIYSGDVRAVNDNGKIVINWSNSISGVDHCPVDSTYIGEDECYFIGASILIGLPVGSMEEGTNVYYVQLDDPLYLRLRSGDETIAKIDSEELSWNINNFAYGNPVVWGNAGSLPVGWEEQYAVTSSPLYTGQLLGLSPYIQLNTVPSSIDNVATNLNYCLTWNSTEVSMQSEFKKFAASNGIIIGDDYGAEYGIIGLDGSYTDSIPSSSSAVCGKYGDGEEADQQSNRIFFSTLEEANNYWLNKIT